MTEQAENVKWVDVVPVLAIAVTAAPTAEERKAAMDQLLHLAVIVDRHIAKLEELAKEAEKKGNIICPDCGVKGGHAFGCPLGAKEDRCFSAR